jgi:hypothetical protein
MTTDAGRGRKTGRLEGRNGRVFGQSAWPTSSHLGLFEAFLRYH